MKVLEQRLRDGIAAQHAAGLYRSLRPLPAGVCDLSSNDYLGLSRDPTVLDAAQEALQKYGAGARSSRLVSGQLKAHQALEQKLAEFKQCEAALLFPSGYQANVAVVTALAQRGDTILCDKRNHASLIDACFLAASRGAKLRFYSSIEKLQTLLSQKNDALRFIVSDAVYSMDGDLAPLPQLLEIAEAADAALILDDAHGTGTLGETGRGALEYFSKLERDESTFHGSRIIQVGTLSKALGAQGGFVVGSRLLIEWLVNSARPFIYTTGLNPVSCGAALAALEVIEEKPQLLSRLQTVKERLADGLQGLGLDAQMQPSPIIPVLIGDAGEAVRMSEKLLEYGVWCPAIRPPTVPRNRSRLRVTATANLSDADIARVIECFAQCV